MKRHTIVKIRFDSEISEQELDTLATAISEINSDKGNFADVEVSVYEEIEEENKCLPN